MPTLRLEVMAWASGLEPAELQAAHDTLAALFDAVHAGGATEVGKLQSSLQALYEMLDLDPLAASNRLATLVNCGGESLHDAKTKEREFAALHEPLRAFRKQLAGALATVSPAPPAAAAGGATAAATTAVAAPAGAAERNNNNAAAAPATPTAAAAATPLPPAATSPTSPDWTSDGRGLYVSGRRFTIGDRVRLRPGVSSDYMRQGDVGEIEADDHSDSIPYKVRSPIGCYWVRTSALMPA